jgi:hypothetical protein
MVLPMQVASPRAFLLLQHAAEFSDEDEYLRHELEGTDASSGGLLQQLLEPGNVQLRSAYMNAKPSKCAFQR